jgi:hypothetical protein
MSFPKRVITSPNGVSTVTAVNADSEQFMFTAHSTHPNYEAIIEGLDSEDPEVWSLFNVAGGLARRFEKITDRVAFDGENVLWDGDVMNLDDPFVVAITRAINSGEKNYAALAKFKEKLESNPNEHSRLQAYDWLAAHNFKITAEGDIVGYKGVFTQADGRFRSWHRSEKPGMPSAYVDGVALPPMDYVYAPVGAEVTLPRSEVTHDPGRACDRGLHVAVFGYAGHYGDTVIEVHVNPRDVVSVPTDANGQKVRACAYKVVRVVTQEAGGNSQVLDPTDTVTWNGDVSQAV